MVESIAVTQSSWPAASERDCTADKSRSQVPSLAHPVEPLVDDVPRTEAIRHISPRSARAESPDHPLNHPAVIQPWTTPTLSTRKQGFDPAQISSGISCRATDLIVPDPTLKPLDQHALAPTLAADAPIFVRHDVREHAEWDRLADLVRTRLGGLDVLVNNAGVSSRADLFGTTEDDWACIFRTNVWAAWTGIRVFSDDLAASDHGCVVNIGVAVRRRRPTGTTRNSVLRRLPGQQGGPAHAHPDRCCRVGPARHTGECRTARGVRHCAARRPLTCHAPGTDLSGAAAARGRPR